MATKGLYPLSTQDGKAIPLDVVKPQSLVKIEFLPATPQDVVIPAGFALCYLYATANCILRMSAEDLPAPLVSGVEYSNAIFIPAHMPMTLLLTEGEASVVADDSGNLYISAVEQWAALLQQRQIAIG